MQPRPRFSEPLGLVVVGSIGIFLHRSILHQESEGRDLEPVAGSISGAALGRGAGNVQVARTERQP